MIFRKFSILQILKKTIFKKKLNFKIKVKKYQTSKFSEGFQSSKIKVLWGHHMD